MVIFGAGASWDSYERLPPPNVNNLRLPLANGLFDSRFGNYYRLFPKCQPLIQRLQRQDVNVENVLEKFQSEETRHPARRTQLVSVRYYLNLMLARCQSDWTDQVTKVSQIIRPCWTKSKLSEFRAKRYAWLHSTTTHFLSTLSSIALLESLSTRFLTTY